MDKKKIMIAIPAYDSKVFVLGMVSIFDNIQTLTAMGHSVDFTFQMGDPYLDLTRNHLVKQFLESDATDMVFVDSDVAFDSDGIVKLMAHDVQIIGGVYPYRSIRENGFPVDIKLDENKFPVVDHEKRLVECDHIPTGFMRIRRDVFDILDKKFPENFDENGDRFHFRTGLLFAHKGDKRYQGEDVYFCKICQEAGIKIWCDPTIGFVHFGTLPKTGKLSDTLRNNGQWVDNPTACNVLSGVKEMKI